MFSKRYEIFLNESPTGLFATLDIDMFQIHENDVSIEVTEGDLVELFAEGDFDVMNLSASVRFD